MSKYITTIIFIFLGLFGIAQESYDNTKLYTFGDSLFFPISDTIQKTAKTPTDTFLPKKLINPDMQVKVETLTTKETTKSDTLAVGKTKIILQNEKNPTDKTKDGIPKLKDLFSFNKIFWSFVLIVLAYFIINFLVFVIDRLSERSTSNRITFKSIAPFIRIIGWSMTFFIIVYGVFRPPFETFIAIAASVGIAVGFAAQDILKNIFGGIMIIFDRPFQLGDKIQVGEHYGEVKEIGLRSCRILTKDDSLIAVPNAEIVNTSVSNANSGEPNCQVVAEIYLPIDVDTNAARQIAIEAAQVSRYIYLNKPITVLFINEIKERRSYLKMRLKAYVSDIRYEFDFQSDMTEIVIEEFLKQKLIDKKDLM